MKKNLNPLNYPCTPPHLYLLTCQDGQIRIACEACKRKFETEEEAKAHLEKDSQGSYKPR